MAKLCFVPLPRGWPRRIQEGLLHAIGLERLALAEARAGFEHSRDPRARVAAELDRVRELSEIQNEELRILRARIEHVPPPRRPHYPPAERLAILMLRTKAGWSAAGAARRFVVTPATIASWARRLDERGEDALVKTAVPVNRFDDAVTLLAHELHRAAPGFGRRKLADMLARAGLHLAASTLGRMLKKPPPPARPPSEPQRAGVSRSGNSERVVSARHPHHVWHCDITSIGIGLLGGGFWTPWWPFALVLRWVLSWHLALVVDHFSRALLAFGVFRKEPTAAEVCALLERAVGKAGATPRHLITDSGAHFQGEYRAWCKKNGVRPRFGAVGRKGSIAVIERFILSLKREFLWKLFVPSSLSKMVAAVATYLRWYNDFRPHASLGGHTPGEVRDGIVHARKRVRFEPRARMPVARGDPTVIVKRCERLVLVVSHAGGFRELAVVGLREAA